MSNKQEAIEPEIVHEIPKQKKQNVKVGKNNKSWATVFLILAVI